MLDEYREANRTNWDDRVPAHLASEFYGVEDFIAGTQNLTQAVGFDCAQLGDVRGRSLLHVQRRSSIPVPRFWDSSWLKM